MEKYKKLFLIIGFVLIVLILGYIIFALFFRPSLNRPEQVGPVATTAPSAGLPTAEKGGGQIVSPGDSSGFATGGGESEGKKLDAVASGGLTLTSELTKTAGLGAIISGNGADIQYYDKTDGKFYRVDKNGQTVTLAEKIFHQVEKITWSQDKNKAILEYPDGANVIYNFSTNKQVTLPAHWKDFSFSPDSQQIVLKSIGQDPNNRWLAVASDDGSKVQGVEQIGKNENSVYPAWSPSGQVVALYTEGIDFNRQEVFFVGLNDENFKSTVVEGRGFQPKWSPVGDHLLYSVYSSDTDLKPNLWLVDAQGDSIGNNRKNLSLETWADKCAFSNNSTVYCAVPRELEAGAGLLPELAKNTTDQLYQIDSTTGLKKLIAIPDGDYTITSIIVSADGRYLYFTDEAKGQLHKIRLQ